MRYHLFYQFHFYLFGLIAIASAITFVTRRSPVTAALWLINTMFCLAVLYIMMDAQFVGAVQVLVYAGAIMVVFLFVIMLLNLGRIDEITDIKGPGIRIAAGGVALALMAELLVLTRSKTLSTLELPPAQENIVNPVAAPLFHDYLLPFELTSVLLLVAIVGAVIVAKRRT
ncbi:MAG TPA: NADH-quinone oxidoreductase subunit J [Gemmatimonadaceae bacterium]|nr:NADH-quinone oxidoreductase subunit J [Gemmatimonadaceae bacterium]